METQNDNKEDGRMGPSNIIIIVITAMMLIFAAYMLWSNAQKAHMDNDMTNYDLEYTNTDTHGHNEQ